MGFSRNENGELVRLVEQPVDENEIEQQLQTEADEAQNALNTANANVDQTEQALADLEAQAEAKAAELETHQAAKEAAEKAVAKSNTDKSDWEAAKQLPVEQPEPQEADGADEDSEGEPSESEAVEVPVNVTTAEG